MRPNGSDNRVAKYLSLFEFSGRSNGSSNCPTNPISSANLATPPHAEPSARWKPAGKIKRFSDSRGIAMPTKWMSLGRCVLSNSLTLLCLRSLQSGHARYIFLLGCGVPPPLPFHPSGFCHEPNRTQDSADLVICGDPVTALLHLM